MSDEIAYATIRDLGKRYRRRELSPVEVTRALLARIEKVDTAQRAFVPLTTERALAEARAGRLLWHRGAQADVRAREPRGGSHALVDTRPHRPDGAHGGGLRVPPPGHGRS